MFLIVPVCLSWRSGRLVALTLCELPNLARGDIGQDGPAAPLCLHQPSTNCMCVEVLPDRHLNSASHSLASLAVLKARVGDQGGSSHISDTR